MGVPIVSLVGYTNAGKSSLLNALTNAAVVARDQLFSTLDPVTRKVVLPDGTGVLMTDTVGFIQKLPTSLVAAFRATLEELQEATVLLHVVDISHKNAPEHVDVVEAILKDLQLTEKPRVLALNKADLLDPAVEAGLPDNVGDTAAVVTSVRTGLGLPELLAALSKVIERTKADPVHVR
jgi:GTP-binding protein HflX